MDLGKALMGALSEFVDDVEEEVQVRVGRISPELENEFLTHKIEVKKVQNEIQAKINEFVKSLQVETTLKKYEVAKMELWEKVYEELGLTEEERGMRYNINHDSRVISRMDTVKKEEEMMMF